MGAFGGNWSGNVTSPQQLAGVIQGEAGTPAGQFAVASTMFNRVGSSGYPSTIQGVVSADQFVGYNPNPSANAQSLANDLWAGNAPQGGSTGNALNFVSPVGGYSYGGVSGATGPSSAGILSGGTNIGGNVFSDNFGAPTSNFQAPQYGGTVNAAITPVNPGDNVAAAGYVPNPNNTSYTMSDGTVVGDGSIVSQGGVNYTVQNGSLVGGDGIAPAGGLASLQSSGVSSSTDAFGAGSGNVDTGTNAIANAGDNSGGASSATLASLSSQSSQESALYGSGFSTADQSLAASGGGGTATGGSGSVPQAIDNQSKTEASNTKAADTTIANAAKATAGATTLAAQLASATSTSLFGRATVGIAGAVVLAGALFLLAKDKGFVPKVIPV